MGFFSFYSCTNFGKFLTQPTLSVVVLSCNHIPDSSIEGFPICIRYLDVKLIPRRWQKTFWGKHDLFLIQPHAMVWVKTGAFTKILLYEALSASSSPEMSFSVPHSFMNHIWFIKVRFMRQNSILSVCICLDTVLYKEPTVLVSRHVLSSSL